MASSATRLPPAGLDLSTPAGLAKALAIGASECLKAAHDLDAGFSDLTGEYIVTFHAIELGLKAFLISKGVTEKQLRKRPFGHDLVHLYEEAKTRGMLLNIPNTDDLISWINEWHCDEVKIRYDFKQARTLPICNALFPLAEAIIALTGKIPNPPIKPTAAE